MMSGCGGRLGPGWAVIPRLPASGAGNRWAAIAAAVRWPDASAAGACGRRPKPGVTSKEGTF